MNTIKLNFLVFIMTISTWAIAQDTTTELKVFDNCGMCKKRIEKASRLSCVQDANWNKGTKSLILKFDKGMVDLTAIESIIGVEHDTKHFLASKESYEKLPSCCQCIREGKEYVYRKFST